MGEIAEAFRYGLILGGFVGGLLIALFVAFVVGGSFWLILEFFWPRDGLFGWLERRTGKRSNG